MNKKKDKKRKQAKALKVNVAKNIKNLKPKDVNVVLVMI
jgi:hypothetical protein